MTLYRHALAILLGAALTCGASAGAQTVQRSGSVYHVAVCGAVKWGYARCYAHVVTDANGNILMNRLQRNTVERKGFAASASAVPNGFGPTSVRAAYNITGMGSSSTIVAIVDAYGDPTAESDLAVYRQEYGLPPCTTANGCFRKLNQAGKQINYPPENVGWAQETSLDLDMVSTTCPNCKIILVEANNASNANLSASVNLAASLGAHVISNSYGGSEFGSETFEPSYNHPGIAITASSGDGAYADSLAQFPATSPHVIAVGGTSLKTANNARGWSETVWATSATEGAGSGCSTVYAKPAWQHDSLCTMRMEADVSAVADPATGVAVYGPANGRQSAWLVFGGTSVAAPLVGGVYAVNGGAVNYGADPYGHLAGLNPVTATGSTGSCNGTYFCTTGLPSAASSQEPYYSGPTGLGTPNGGTAF